MRHGRPFQLLHPGMLSGSFGLIAFGRDRPEAVEPLKYMVVPTVSATLVLIAVGLYGRYNAVNIAAVARMFTWPCREDALVFSSCRWP